MNLLTRVKKVFYIRDATSGNKYQNLVRDTCPIFWGLQFGQILFSVLTNFWSTFLFLQNARYIWSLINSQLFFEGVLSIIVSHTWILETDFYVWIFGSFYFFEMEVTIIPFFHVVKTFSRRSIPVNQMLVSASLGLFKYKIETIVSCKSVHSIISAIQYNPI